MPGSSAPIVNALGYLRDPHLKVVDSQGRNTQPLVSRRSLSDARASGVAAVNITIGHVYGPADPYGYSMQEVTEWTQAIEEHPDDLMLVRGTADILQAQREDKIGLILGFQNADMLGDEARRVDTFAKAGVRVIQLTYNSVNRLGGGATAAGDPGLTEFGREVLERLADQRVIADLSHSGERLCLDSVAASPRPVAITHTGCRALADLRRNKTDEELRRVADRGGFIGIYFMPFLTTGRNATLDDVVAHLEHAINVVGEDHVGLGTDTTFSVYDDMTHFKQEFAKLIAFRRETGISAAGEAPDIYPFVEELLGPEQFRLLSRRLAERGHGSSRIDKILGLNFLRYAQEVWGD
jgi:membrane dipeptidase